MLKRVVLNQLSKNNKNVAINAHAIKSYNTINLTNASIVKANVIANAKYNFGVVLGHAIKIYNNGQYLVIVKLLLNYYINKLMDC